MSTYGLLVTIYLSYLGIQTEWRGFLLWPAVVAHSVLTLLLLHAMIATLRIVPETQDGKT